MREIDKIDRERDREREDFILCQLSYMNTGVLVSTPVSQSLYQCPSVYTGVLVSIPVS